jgi:O-antigen/teichoic acid export membrane protein
MQKRQVLINAVFSVAQILVIGIVIFILYRFLLNTLGVKQLGIWSLILSTTSVAQVANFGLSGSVVKFVAKYLARNENENISEVIQTAAISLGIFIGLALLISYPLIVKVLSLVVPEDSLPLAVGILPYALGSLWLMMIFSVFQAGLDGFQRIDLRGMILIASSVLNLVLCFILTPAYGLLGVAYARVIQMAVTLMVGWIMLRRYVRLPVMPYRWNKQLFGEIVKYGIKYQTISVTILFYDPVTKALLSKFGNLSMVGYYEMANRMIQQFRGLIVSANQVLFPAIAELKENAPEKIQSVYQTSYQLLFYLALPMFSLIIVALPLISKLWIGHYEGIFVTFGVLLAVGWFLNTLNAPAYFVYLGAGELKWNVFGHIVIAILNPILGFLLGHYFGGTAVVGAWVFSLALGSSLIYFSYHIKNGIPLIELLPQSSRLTIIVCLSGIILNLILQHNLDNTLNSIAANSTILFVFLIIIVIPIWLHPMRRRLVGWVSSELLNKKAGF